MWGGGGGGGGIYPPKPKKKKKKNQYYHCSLLYTNRCLCIYVSTCREGVPTVLSFMSGTSSHGAIIVHQGISYTLHSGSIHNRSYWLETIHNMYRPIRCYLFAPTLFAQAVGYLFKRLHEMKRNRSLRCACLSEGVYPVWSAALYALSTIFQIECQGPDKGIYHLQRNSESSSVFVARKGRRAFKYTGMELYVNL